MMGTLPTPTDVAMSWCVCTTEATSGRAWYMATCSIVSRGGTGASITRPCCWSGLQWGWFADMYSSMSTVRMSLAAIWLWARRTGLMRMELVPGMRALTWPW